MIRRLYDLIKALTALALAGGVLVGLALAGIALAGRPGLVYGLIEYLALAALILGTGNLLVAWFVRRRAVGPTDPA